MDSPDDSAYGHDDTDITTISYVLESANNGKGGFVCSVMTQMCLSY